MSGKDLMHPISDVGEARPTYNVFAEQEKAFFKRGSGAGGTNYYEQSQGVTSIPGQQKRPSSSSSSPSTSTNASPTSSASRPTYTTMPPYRAAAPVQPNPNPTASNQFGVLVPGWTSAQDPGPLSSSTGSDTQDAMQFVPVATKGSGAPGRGPTKRKKA